MTDLAQVRRALISVSDKTGLVDFARGLAERGVELLSTGGSAKTGCAPRAPLSGIASAASERRRHTASQSVPLDGAQTAAKHCPASVVIGAAADGRAGSKRMTRDIRKIRMKGLLK